MSSEPERKKARTRGSRGVAARGKREAENATAEAHSASSGVVAEVGDDVDWVELTDDAKKLLRYRGNQQLDEIDRFVSQYNIKQRDAAKLLRVLYENGLHGKCMAPRGSSLLRFLDISDLVGEVSSFLIGEESKSKIQHAELVARGLQRIWTRELRPLDHSRVWWAAYGNDVGTLGRLISVEESAGKPVAKEDVLQAGVNGDAPDVLRYLYERWGVPSEETQSDLVEESARYNRARALEFLLENGAKVDSYSLHPACEFLNARVVRILLQHEVDVNYASEGTFGRMTPLLWVFLQYRPYIVITRETTRQNRGIGTVSIPRFIARKVADEIDPELGRSSIAITRMLLEAGANANPMDKDRNTPLSLAIRGRNNEEAVKLLLEHGADYSIRDYYGDTPLALAVRLRELGCVQALLEHGADVNSRENDGETPVSLAYDDFDYKKFKIDANSPEGKKIEENAGLILRLLLEHGADPNSTDDEGRAPIMYAINCHDASSVALMVEHGANPNFRGWRKETPLHVVSRAGDLELVQRVLDAGADVNIVNEDEETPLFVACSFRLEVVLEESEASSGRGDLVRKEAYEGRASCIRELLKRGADPNVVNKSRETPLMRLCAGESHDNHFEIAQLLIEHGADVQFSGKDGRRPLHVAAMNRGQGDLVRLLLEHGAKPNEKTGLNEYPLPLAAESGSDGGVCALLEHGADVNVRVKKSVGSLLHLAARSGLEGGMQALLDQGLEVDATDAEGCTPLMEAMENTSTARILIEHGANVNARNKRGDTPILHAVRSSDCEAEAAYIRLLLEHGAEVDAVDSNGSTPLTLAVQSGRVDICEELASKGREQRAAQRAKRRADREEAKRRKK